MSFSKFLSKIRVVAKSSKLYFLMLFLLGISVFVFVIILQSAPAKWEYTTLTLNNSGNSRIGDGSEKYETIQFNQSEVNRLGDDGWELVSSYLEMETAFVNFGNEKYVTGLQPNTRPQRLICIFKRRK